MRKKLRLWLLALVLCLSPSTLHATDYLYLNVKSNDASTDFELASIQKITFTGENMVLWLNGEQVEIAMANIEKMLISDMTTGIVQQQLTQPEDIKVEDGKLTIQDGAVITVYTLNGRVAKNLVANGQLQVDLSDLPKGIYIVKVGKQARKIINR